MLAVVIGWQLYQMRDLCMTGSKGGSCPALADVDGIRYYVGGSRELVNVDGALTPYGEIAQTNVPEALNETTAYSLAGIDPKLALVGMSTRLVGDARGPYRLLMADLGDSPVWPALCRYLPAGEDVRCN